MQSGTDSIVRYSGSVSRIGSVSAGVISAAGLMLLLASCGDNEPRIEEAVTGPVRVEPSYDEIVGPDAPVAERDRVSEFDRLILRLEGGVERLRQRSGNAAEVMLHERVDGELQEPHVIDLFCRHEPFSTYLKWTEGPVGREVIYVTGENDDKVVVHPEGVRGRLVSRIAMAQDNPLIMSERRYPISEFGLLKMNERLVNIFSGYTDSDIEIRCESHAVDGSADRPGTEFRVELARPVADDVYKCVILLLDEELSVAVKLNCFTWPEHPSESEDDTLIESYEYRSISSIPSQTRRSTQQIQNTASAADHANQFTASLIVLKRQ